MLKQIFKHILRSRGSKLSAMFSSILFAVSYPFLTGMIVRVDLHGYGGVYQLYNDPYMVRSIYAIVTNDGWMLIVSPLTLTLLAINTLLIGLNIGGFISMLRAPGCCRGPAAKVRTGGFMASSAVLAFMGTSACCGTFSLLPLFLVALGISAGGFASLITYGYLLQTLASLLLTVNLIYIYRRLKRVSLKGKGFRLRDKQRR